MPTIIAVERPRINDLCLPCTRRDPEGPPTRLPVRKVLLGCRVRAREPRADRSIPAPEILLSPISRSHLRRLALAGLAAAAIGGGAAMAPLAGGEPAAIESQRADVARVQAELRRIDAQVADAAEAFNGGQHRLGQIEERIGANQEAINSSQLALAGAQVALTERLRHLYAHPEPDLAEILVSTASLGDAMDSMRALEQVSRRDTAVVEGIRGYRVELEEARDQLARDQQQSRREVAAARQQRERVLALLDERQAVLDAAQGELGRLLAAEEERQAREAERQRRIALERQQAQERAPAPTVAAPGATPTAPSGAQASAPAAVPAPAPAAAPAASASAPPPASSANAQAARIAVQYVGTPYVWGGGSPSGFDCSGLCSFAYAQVGKSVPHYTVAIYNQFPRVSRDQLQPGDMVFFRGLGHMGMYIGGGQMVHAPQTGDVVKISPISIRSDYVGAVRP